MYSVCTFTPFNMKYPYTHDAEALLMLRNKIRVWNHELRTVALSHRDSIYHLRKLGLLIKSTRMTRGSYVYTLEEDNKSITIRNGKIHKPQQLVITEVSRESGIDEVSEEETLEFLDKLGKKLTENHKNIQFPWTLRFPIIRKILNLFI